MFYALKRKLGYLIGLALVAFVLFSCSSTANSANDNSGQNIQEEKKVVFESTFEDTLDGWSQRSNELVALTPGKGHGGGQALNISGRTSTWNGPVRDFISLIEAGKTYNISLWVMFEEGNDSQAFNLSIERKDGGDSSYTTIGSINANKGEWTQIDMEYTVPDGDSPIAKIYLETPWKSESDITDADLLDFYIDDFTIAYIPPVVIVEEQTVTLEAEKDIPNLSDFFDFPIGVAMDNRNLKSENLQHELLRHFDVYVYGNEMKQDATQPREGTFRLTKGDELVAYAQEEGKEVRGHTLVWHSQYPGWLFKDGDGEPTKEVLLQRLETHITTLLSHWKGQVKYWDVCNEVIESDGSLRQSPYYNITGGDEYIVKAFEYAHAADPDAKLFINDYGVEGSGAKQDGYYNLVKSLLDRGVPIDGVGFQAHISMRHPTVAEFEKAIERFAALGVDVQITELDVSIYANAEEKEKPITRDLLMDQAYRYKELFDMFQRQYEKGNLELVMVWGLDDKNTWLNNHPTPNRPDHPLLFGKDLIAKPAYWIFADPESLPLYSQKKQAINVKKAVTSLDDEMWQYTSPSDILDSEGVNNYGEFKLLWDAGHLYINATIKDSSSNGTDKITVFIEPRNQKGEDEESASSDYIQMDFMRSDAQIDDGSSYTILATVPLTCKENEIIGFDIAVFDGDKQHSWNDFENIQSKSSFNLGGVSFKKLVPTTYAKRLQGSISIDGSIDNAWKNAEPVKMKVETMGETSPNSQFRTLWDDNYLYVLMEVEDSYLNDDNANDWEQDSVEVFIDQNNAKSTSYDSDDSQYRVNFNNVTSFNGACNEELLKTATAIVDGGYIVEMAIPLDFTTPELNDLIGFDTQVNEADESATRTGIRNWVNDTNLGYQDMSGLGVVMLVE